MRHWTRRILALAGALLLTGCLWSPGKFTSELQIRKNGTFVLDYRGEIILQRPEEKGKPAAPWSDSMARCFDDGRAEMVEIPPDVGPDTEPPPVPESQNDLRARREAEALAQALDQLARRRDRFQRPGEMRFEGVKFSLRVGCRTSFHSC